MCPPIPHYIVEIHTMTTAGTCACPTEKPKTHWRLVYILSTVSLTPLPANLLIMAGRGELLFLSRTEQILI